MIRILFFLSFLLVIPVFLGCEAENNINEIPDNAPESFGTVLTINKESKTIQLNITQWAEENGYLSEEQTDLGKMDNLRISNSTILKFESGKKASLEDIRENQKIKVLKDTNGEVKELILLEE